MGRFVLAITAVLLFASCHRASDPLIGRWTVEKVNVEFNEQIATPEMVRQYGELEKGNVIEIAKDSIISLISEGDTLRGKCSLSGTQLFFDGKVFGRYENGQIETDVVTPIGVIKVLYFKK